MEARAMTTIKRMLNDDGIQAEYESVADALDETRMFMFGPILIVFSDKTRVTDREFNKIIEFSQEKNLNGGIVIVTPTAPSDLVLSSLRRYIGNPDNPLVQIFEIRHLGFDIAEHRQVPKHKILKQQELDTFLKEYGLSAETIHLLPKIDCQDPMAKRIRARPGNVVEIRGLSMTSGEYRHARLCVEST
jgi:DNA-directed RNA polymerase subunit H (RpoH/RPB5)